MYANVALRQAEIGKLVFAVPTPGQRRIVLVHHGVQSLQTVLALLAERAGGPAAVGHGTAASAVRRADHRRVAAVRAGRHLRHDRRRDTFLVKSRHRRSPDERSVVAARAHEIIRFQRKQNNNDREREKNKKRSESNNNN